MHALRRLVRWLPALCSLLALCAVPTAAQAAAAPPLALVHGDSVRGGASSVEATAATNAGFAVTVVSGTQWASMTQAEFAAYQLIVVGDTGCGAIPASVAENVDTWAPVVMGTAVNTQPGNRIAIGTDPLAHASPTSNPERLDLVDAGIRYAGTQAGRTGLYFDTSCDGVYGLPTRSPAAILQRVSAGTGTWTEDNTPPCGGNVSIIAANPAFSSVTKSDLQGWGCSVHKTFPTYASDWSPFAIATDTADKPTCGTDTETDAPACGQAYVLIAGGGTVVAAPNLALNPADNTSVEGGSHTLTATVTDPDATPKVGQLVTFTLTGTNAGATGSCLPVDCTTDANGMVAFTYADAQGAGDDTITASFTSAGSNQQANAVQHWTAAPVAPAVTLHADNPLAPSEGPQERSYAYDVALTGAGNDVGSVSTSCGTAGAKVAGSDANTATGGSFSCVFADGPDSSTVSASVTDSNGLSDESTQSVTVANVAPTATLDAGNALSVNEGSAQRTFSYTTSDVGQDSVSVVTDCGANGAKVIGSDADGSFGCTFAAGNRSSTVSVTPTDSDGAAGAVVSQVVAINDVTAPQSTIDSGPVDGSTTRDRTPAFGFSSDEAGSTFTCRIDTGEAFACESAYMPAALDDGPHTFSVIATDASGNADPTAATRSFTVDTTRPQTTLQSGPPAGSTTGDSTPTFEFSSSETGSTFMCRIDGGTEFSCTSAYTPDALSDGPHTFSVTAVDAAGNVGATATTRAFTIDTTPPPAAPRPITTAPRPPATKTPSSDAAPIRCASRRRFVIHLRPKDVRLTSAVVRANHVRVEVRRVHGRLQSTVDLRGLKRGTYPVAIDARDARGRHYHETRRYKVC